MADYDPAHQSGAWDENGEYEVTDGNEQEDIEQHSSDEVEVQAEYSVDPASHASGDLPSPDGATDDVGEDYDPESVTSAAAAGVTLQPAADHVPLRPSPQRAAKQKPRTAGGFLVGDSDSEDDETPVPASSGLAPGAASPPQNPITAKKSTAASSHADPTPEVNATTELPAGRQENGNAAAPPAMAGSLPQIPIDRTTQLENRVRDDPRGAMDAWLALIAEYRSRGDVAQTRQIYDRFLAVFPQAVSRSSTWFHTMQD